MAKIRLFALANKLGLRTEALIKVLSDMGVENVSLASAVDPDTASAAVELLAEQAEEARRQAQAAAEAQATTQETRAEPEETEEAVAAEEWEEQFARPVHDADLKASKRAWPNWNDTWPNCRLPLIRNTPRPRKSSHFPSWRRAPPASVPILQLMSLQ